MAAVALTYSALLRCDRKLYERLNTQREVYPGSIYGKNNDELSGTDNGEASGNVSDESKRGGTNSSIASDTGYPALDSGNVILTMTGIATRCFDYAVLKVSCMCSYASYNSVVVLSNSRKIAPVMSK